MKDNFIIICVISPVPPVRVGLSHVRTPTRFQERRAEMFKLCSSLSFNVALVAHGGGTEVPCPVPVELKPGQA